MLKDGEFNEQNHKDNFDEPYIETQKEFWDEGNIGAQYKDLCDLEFWEGEEIDEETYLMLTDFKSFVRVVFDELSLQSPTKYQEDVCDYLQYGPRRAIVMSYRGIGKSYIACMYALWLLYRDPNTKTLIISVAEDKAAENSNFIKNIIMTTDFLSYLDPKQAKSSSNAIKKSSSLAFEVAPCKVEQAPSVKAAGISGRITGSRADIIIFDDIESIENSTSHKKRDYILHKCVVEGESILKNENKQNKIIYLGTPQTFQSIYFTLDTFEIKIWPLRYPNQTQYDKFFNNYLADSVKEELENDPTLMDPGYGLNNDRCRVADPQRYTEEETENKEYQMGGSNFDLQYMLYTHSSDQQKYKLKFKDLIVDDLDLQKAAGSYTWTNANGNMLNDIPTNSLMTDAFYSPIAKSDSYFDYETTRMYIDVSGRGADEMAYCVLKSLNGLIFLMEVGGVPNYDKENLVKLCNVAKKYQVNDVKCEDNFGDGMFKSLLEPVLNKIYPTSLDGFKVGNQVKKEVRMQGILQPLFETHRIVVDTNCILMDNFNLPECGGIIENSMQYSLFYQISRLTSTPRCLGHDDRIDIFASGCADLIEFLDRDVNDEDKRKTRENDILGLDEYSNDISDFAWNC